MRHSTFLDGPLEVMGHLLGECFWSPFPRNVRWRRIRRSRALGVPRGLTTRALRAPPDSAGRAWMTSPFGASAAPDGADHRSCRSQQGLLGQFAASAAVTDRVGRFPKSRAVASSGFAKASGMVDLTPIRMVSTRLL
jgi:hypothetical protein